MQTYIISIIFFYLVLLFAREKIKYPDDDMYRKMAIVMNEERSDIKYPELFGFVPIINVLIGAFLLWFLLTDAESVARLDDYFKK